MTDSSIPLHEQAIHAALTSNWQEALRLNQIIIEAEPENVDALNRLARAYFEVGKLNESKKHYQKSLKIDPYNQIAYKFLKRIETFDKKGARNININTQIHTPIATDLFIEEPGRTKIVTLLKVAEPQRLSMLVAGEIVFLVAKNRGVVITDQNGKYLGIIPDDLSRKLIRLMHGGNKYQALIKTIKTNGLSVLIREVYRSARFKNQPSFLDSMISSNISYSSDHIIVPQDSEDSPSEGDDDESME